MDRYRKAIFAKKRKICLKMREPKDITGRRFGKLIALERATPIGVKHIKWTCRCDCGTVKEINLDNLCWGRSKSCGCMVPHGHTTHGYSHLPEFHAWRNMWCRCTNPLNSGFKNYGGRGLGVCDRWKDYERFIEDMGPRPSKWHSLDRIDNDKGYSPDNCRWATREVQARNKRNPKISKDVYNEIFALIEKGTTRREIAKLYGVNRGRISQIETNFKQKADYGQLCFPGF